MRFCRDDGKYKDWTCPNEISFSCRPGDPAVGRFEISLRRASASLRFSFRIMNNGGRTPVRVCFTDASRCVSFAARADSDRPVMRELSEAVHATDGALTAIPATSLRTAGSLKEDTAAVRDAATEDS